MNNKQLEAAVYEPRCRFCQFKKGHPEVASLIEYKLVVRRSTYTSISELLKQDFGWRIAESQIRNHIKKHLPEQAIIVRQSMERGLDGLETVHDLSRQNLLIWQTIKELGVHNLERGEIVVDGPMLLRSLEQQNKAIEGEKIVINYGNQMPIMSNDLFMELLEVVYDFVPIHRRMEFREAVDQKFRTKLMDAARHHLELEAAEEGEVIEVDGRE